MPKVGISYSVSPEGRLVDRMLVAGLRPALKVGEFSARQAILHSDFPQLDTFYDQTRIGQHAEPFEMHKLQTLCPGTKIPLNKAAAMMRRHGFDEIAQLKNIREGKMSFFGYRSLIPEEYEEVLDNVTTPRLKNSWQRIIDLTLPGVLSSYGMHHHVHPKGDGVNSEYDIRVILDIHDAIHASTRYNMGLLAKFVKIGAQRGL